jgi:hypothetical protein
MNDIVNPSLIKSNKSREDIILLSISIMFVIIYSKIWLSTYLEAISKYELGLILETVQSNIKGRCIHTPQDLDYVLYVLKRVILNVYYIQSVKKGARRYRRWRGNQKFISRLLLSYKASERNGESQVDFGICESTSKSFSIMAPHLVCSTYVWIPVKW